MQTLFLTLLIVLDLSHCWAHFPRDQLLHRCISNIGMHVGEEEEEEGGREEERQTDRQRE